MKLNWHWKADFAGYHATIMENPDSKKVDWFIWESVDLWRMGTTDTVDQAKEEVERAMKTLPRVKRKHSRKG